jgi:hypothetical protein
MHGSHERRSQGSGCCRYDCCLYGGLSFRMGNLTTLKPQLVHSCLLRVGTKRTQAFGNGIFEYLSVPIRLLYDEDTPVSDAGAVFRRGCALYTSIPFTIPLDL